MTNLQLPVCALVAANTAKNMKMTTETKTRGDLIFLSLANLINSTKEFISSFNIQNNLNPSLTQYKKGTETASDNLMREK